MVINKELGNYCKIIDQAKWFIFEGILLEEEVNPNVYFNEITVYLTKLTVNGKDILDFKPGIAKLPKPRYTPVFMRHLTKAEEVLYGQKTEV